MLSNQEKFNNTASILDDNISRYSRIDWIPISSFVKQEIVYQIHYKEVESLYGKEEIISAYESKTLLHERNPQVHSMVTIVLDLNK